MATMQKRKLMNDEYIRLVTGGGVYPEIAYIDANTLVTDPRYQRNLRPSHVNNLINDFRPELFQPLTVNQRSWENDRLVVIDGQHRVIAVRGLDTEFHQVPMQVLHLSSLEEETDAFLLINTLKKNLNAFDKLEPHLIKGEQYAKDIWNAIDSIEKLRLPYRNEDTPKDGLNNVITCVDTLHTAWKMVADPNLKQGEIMEKTLNTIFPAWQDQANNTKAYTVDGISNFIRCYYGTQYYSEDIMEETMQNHSPSDVKELADRKYPRKGGGKGGDGTSFARSFIDFYNLSVKKKSNKIRDDKYDSLNWIDMKSTTARTMKLHYLEKTK